MDPLTTHMRRALKLARRGEGYVEPNPMVGCVIVQGEKVVGEGWHRRFGGAHAEVVALRQAGPAARGATVVVTLEPCCRQGKTAPCTGALIEAGVGEVVIGCLDPTPEVDGRGVGELEAAGITTRMGPLHEEATRLVAPFIKRMLTGFPYVMLKWAATVDGAIATGSGDSKWISGEASRRRVHQWRSRVDAVLVGIGTVLADDPSLTARDVRHRRVARRVVVDPQMRLPMHSELVHSLETAPLTVALSSSWLKSKARRKVKSLQKRGVEVVPLPRRRGRRGDLDLKPLLRHLAEKHQATNLLVEGGARTIGCFIDQELADELLVFVGPKLLADPRQIPPVVLPGRRAGGGRIDQALNLRLESSQQLDDDILLRYRLA